jgi:glutamine synthetase
MSPKEVLEYAAKHEARQLDLRFTDLPGLNQHISYPISMLKEDVLEEGFGIDGSSIRGWAAINESDMLLIPDGATAFMDPFNEVPTVVMTCDVIDPITRQHYDRDPRWIAKKAEMFLQSSGIADTAYFGAEAEFFIFDNVRFDQTANTGFYFIDAEEGRWNSGREKDNLGYRPRYKEGYFPVPPTDHYQDLRAEMVEVMIQCGLDIECHHHEVATGGQCEIDQRFDTMVKSADNMMLYKYIVRNVAYQYGKSVTFMPKPLFGDNGSGMHCHQSLWKGGNPLFAGDGYAGLSEMALHYIGGLLKHARALSAIIAPTTNSYKRLVPGYEAPGEPCLFAPATDRRPYAFDVLGESEGETVEFGADPCATVPRVRGDDDGWTGWGPERIAPGEPLDKDIYDLSPEELKMVPSMPGSLDEALTALEEDYSFLLKGDVFSEELIEPRQLQAPRGSRGRATAPASV